MFTGPGRAGHNHEYFSVIIMDESQSVVTIVLGGTGDFILV